MGTEEFWVPAVMAAVAGGAQAVNQRQATNRQNTAEIGALEDQQALQSRAVGAARALTSKIATDNPNAIAAKATGDYVSQLRRNAAGSTQGGPTTGGTQTFGASTSALAPAAGASSRYAADTAKSQKDVEDYGTNYADEMGSIDAATRMRQNEGLSMENLSTGLNRMGAQSYGTNFVDQLRAQTTGQPNPWVSLFSNLLGGAAGGVARNWSPSGTTVNTRGPATQAGNPGYGGASPVYA